MSTKTTNTNISVNQSGKLNGQTKTKLAYINDQSYQMEDGETVLSFVRRHHGNEEVPTLCDAPNLDPFGSCRVCSVEVALEKGGKAKTVASCHTPLAEGFYIYTSTEKMHRLRKNIVELVLQIIP